MREELNSFFKAHIIKGFLDHDEGLALNTYAKSQSSLGPGLELGSYCGKSTVYLGLACQSEGQTLYAVDHHRGSEEHQAGEEYHDPELYDEKIQRLDSFPDFRRTLSLAGLEDTVVPLVTSSELARRDWQTPLAMVFVDGGHSHEMAINDCLGWAKRIMPKGVLAIHDIFEKPEDGGQGPYLGMKAVIDTGQFQLEKRVKTLVFLRKIE